jgi:hypothetical protein
MTVEKCRCGAVCPAHGAQLPPNCIRHVSDLPTADDQGNFGILVMNQGGKNRADARNQAKLQDLLTHAVVLCCLQES